MRRARRNENVDLKLGKLKPRLDKRTIRLKDVLRAELLPPLPDSFDVDSSLGGITDNNIYGNDALADCVIAGRAHMTLRFEDFEQRKIIPITNADVEGEYFKETGGKDSGLTMLDSLNCWRRGWRAAGETYDIYAYASFDCSNHDESKYAIVLLRGAYIGIQLPQSAMTQFQNGQEWDVIDADGGILGGHCVYVLAFDQDSVTCVTWGKRQLMTWAFWDKYCDEAYGIVQDKEHFVTDSPVDVNRLDDYLTAISER